MAYEEKVKREFVCIRLTIGLIKELDEEVIRINKMPFGVTDRSKFIRSLIKKELEKE